VARDQREQRHERRQDVAPLALSRRAEGDHAAPLMASASNPSSARHPI
jgi:hypothetical protein